MKETAWLGSRGEFTTFRAGETTITFCTSPRLLRYEVVREWDRGYLVVDALYAGGSECEEDYIDLVPILENLYMDPEAFCNRIEEVRVER